MRCGQCGAEIEDGAFFCSKCGAGLNTTNGQESGPVMYGSPSYAASASRVPYPRTDDEGLLLAAFVLNVISTIVLACSIIGLAWAIPMTVHSYGVYKGTKPNTVAFGVCTLLFLNLISGILNLVAKKDL